MCPPHLHPQLAPCWHLDYFQSSFYSCRVWRGLAPQIAISPQFSQSLCIIHPSCIFFDHNKFSAWVCSLYPSACPQNTDPCSCPISTQLLAHHLDLNSNVATSRTLIFENTLLFLFFPVDFILLLYVHLCNACVMHVLLCDCDDCGGH